MRQAIPSAEHETAAATTVRPFAETDAPEWERFAAAAPDATFFHRLPWRDVVERGLGHRGHYRCAWRGERLVGILPLFHVRSRLFGSALVSVAFAVYGGIVAADPAAAAALAADAAALGASLGVDHVELRHVAPSTIGWKTKSDFYFTFCRRLAPARDANLKAIPRKKRADLRKAIDNPALRVEVGTDLDTFFRIYAESVRNLGTPVLPRRFYAAIVAGFGDAVELSAVHGPDGPVAALMTFYFRDRVMPYYGGATPAARPLHAYDLLYWSLMERAVERGATLFDFGRSKRGTGAYDYKTYWGFEPEPLHYDFHLVRGGDLPDVNPLNPKYRLMIETWRRLPLPIANALGPIVARQLG
ncbi:MAG TPA: FemAB family XrtA/PEP-CTERM system-associated protein [Stellaceae bacterium]|nr:FemAB family XrtA/PEP-CTERM system-associated protein [Stellaceae bacterium]